MAGIQYSYFTTYIYCFLARTALHWACKRNHVGIVEYLLRKGADVNLVSHKNESMAEVTNNYRVLKLLSEYG